MKFALQHAIIIRIFREVSSEIMVGFDLCNSAAVAVEAPPFDLISVEPEEEGGKSPAFNIMFMGETIYKWEI